MNTPETQSPIDTTDIPIDNIGNRKTLRKKGSASTNETQLRDGPVQRSAAEQNPAVFAAADSFGCAAAAVQRDRHCRSRKFAGSNAMAAVGSTTSLFNLLVNSFIGISVGANVLVARHYGERDYDGVQQTHPDGAAHRLIGGAILIVLGVCSHVPC